MGNAENLNKAVLLLERLKKFVSLKSESACQARREALRYLVKNLGQLNEARSKYGIHGSLEEPLKQLEYLANRRGTKDLGTHVTLDRDFTQPKMSDGDKLSFIDQLNLWANKIEEQSEVEDGTISVADKWLKVKDAANLLAVNRGVISRWANEGRITGNGKTGKLRRVLKSSVLLLKQDREDAELLEDAKDLHKDSKKFR